MVREMKRIDKVVNGDTYVIEKFNSFDEIIEVCNSRERKTSDNVRSCFSNSTFMGTNSYDEAVKLMKYGESKDIQRMKKTIIDLERTQSTYKTSFRNDVVGFAPIVPNAIMGVPQSMIRSTKVAKPFKIITITVDMAVSGGVSPDQVFEYGVDLVKKIVQLENNGYRVKLEYLKCFNVGRNHIAMTTVIKNENQPIDIKRITFPLTNVAMQRYISWDWFERVPNAKYDDSKGRSLSTFTESSGSYSTIKRKEICKEIVDNAKDKYVICYGDNLEEIFRGME